MIANGKYTKDGVEKTKWVEVAIIMEKNGKEYALLDPTINLAGFPREEGRDKLIGSIFDDNNQQRPSQQTSQYKAQPAPVGSFPVVDDATGDALPF